MAAGVGVRKRPRLRHALIVPLLLWGQVANASVEGTAPAKVGNWRLFGAHSTIGSALMVAGISDGEINTVLLPSATAQMREMPFDAQVVAAYLFWSGSSPRTFRDGLPDPPDQDIDLTLPDGSFYNNLSADTDMTGFGTCRTTSELGGFYYCRRDVTEIAQTLGPGDQNGVWTVGDVDADWGIADPSDAQWPFAQAKYAGWSLIIVWEGRISQTVRRDVVLYDGFLRLDENANSAGIHTFSIGDFRVGEPPLGKLSVFGMEGDRQLGVPPQDLLGCPNCLDFIQFQAQSSSAPAILWDGDNPAYNSFNSSTSTSIDIDTYYLDGLIDTGDLSAQITLGSGDGVVDGFYNQGNGESFFVGWVIMTIDTLTPNFGGTQTRKTVVPVAASPGQSLYYIIDVVNEGSLGATGVLVTDDMPAGTTYVVGSTRVDGMPVADVSGNSPLVGGLRLRNIPTSRNGDNSVQVTYQVKVETTACGGDIVNTATVDANEVDPVTVGPAITRVAVPALEPPTKRVSFISAPPVGPGSAFNYTIDIENAGNEDAAGVTVTDTLPEHVIVSSVFATSGTWSQSGRDLTVRDMNVPARSSAQVVVTARVRTVGELIAAGIAEDAIDRMLIANQATVSGGCTPDQVTDDPDAPGFQPTEFELIYRPVLDSSRKTAVDTNGGRLEPLDIIEYTITVQNTGNRATLVFVADLMPAGTTLVPGSVTLDGVGVPDGVLGSGLSMGVLSYAGAGDFDRRIRFRLQVDLLVENGTVIQNSADVSAPAAPDANVTVTSPAFTVYAAPDWQTSTKSVVDRTAPIGVFQPGDSIEYNVVVENTGNRPGTSVVVTDVLPTYLSFVSAPGGTFAGGTITWNLGDVAVDATVTLTVLATLVTPLNHGTVIANAAVIASNELTPFTTPQASFSVTSQPLLVVEKVRYPDNMDKTVGPGDPVEFRIRVRNVGNMTARSVVVSDPVDSNLTDVAVIGGSYGGNVATWNVGDLGPADGTVELVFIAQVVFPLANATLIANQATVAFQGAAPALSDDPATAAANDPTTLMVVSQATVGFTKTVVDLSASTPPLPGDRVRYTLTLTAGGDAPLTNVFIADPIDPALTDVDASMSFGNVTGSTVTWSVATGHGDLAVVNPGESVELVFTAVIAPGTANGTVVTNQATAASGALAVPVLSDDPSLPGAVDPTRFSVVSEPFLVMTKTAALIDGADSEFNPGDEVLYTITLTNVGTAQATAPRVVDTFAALLSIIDAAGGRQSGSAITWQGGGPLAAGASRTFSPRVRIAFPLDDGTVISNQASATASNFPGPALSDDPALPGNTDPTLITVRSAPVFTDTEKQVADITGDPLITRPGDQLRYTLIVRNTGNSDADDVVVSDALPAHAALVDAGNATFNGPSLNWDGTTVGDFGRMAAGTEVTLTFVVSADNPLANGTTISNQAFVVSDEVTESVASDDLATATIDDPTVVTVVSASDLGGSTKVVTNLSGNPISTARPTETVRYVISVSNRGDAVARNVAVTDVVDANLSIVNVPNGVLSGDRITWNASNVAALAAIAPGDPAITLTFDAELNTPLDNGMEILNQASLSWDGAAEPLLTDANPSTLNKEETKLTVVSAPDLRSSTKEFVRPGSGEVIAVARPGDAVRMLLTLENSGDAVARNVVVGDIIDTNLLTSVVARDGGSLSGDTAYWSGLEVAPGIGNRVVLRIDARLREPLDPSTLVNQAFIAVGGAPPLIPTDDPSTAAVDDPTVLNIRSVADFSTSTKDVVGFPEREVAPGADVTYTLRVDNTGDGNAHNVEVVDTLPREVELVNAVGATYDGATRTLKWTLPQIRGGQAVNLGVTVRVASLLANGTAIDNQATISADGGIVELTDDPEAPAPDAPTRLTVVATPSFALFEKSVVNLDASAPGVLRAGDRLQYTLRLQNDGNAVATNVVVRDFVDPTVLTDVEVVTSHRREANDVVFDESTVPRLSSLAPGEGVDLVFIASVHDQVADGAQIANQAFVTSVEVVDAEPSDDPATTDLDDPTVVVARYPDLRITKSFVDLNGEPAEPGDVIRFNLLVENQGSFAAQDVVVSDMVRDEFEQPFDVRPPSATPGRTLTWNFAEIAAGARVELTFTTRIPASTKDGAEIFNEAKVAALGLKERQSRVDVVVHSEPNFENTTMSVSPRPEASREDLLTYRIKVPNTGSGPGRAVVVQNPLTLLGSFVELVEIRNGGSVSGDAIVWVRGEIRPADTLEVEFDVRIRPDTPNRTLIANQASVTWTGAAQPVLSDDPATAALDDPTEVTVIAEAKFAGTLLAAIDVNGGSVLPGDVIEYELTVINSGNVDAVESVARLPMPSYSSLVGSTLLNGEVVAALPGEPPLSMGLPILSLRPGTTMGVVLADDGSDPVDEHVVVKFATRIDPRALAGTVISAQAAITANGVYPGLSDNPATPGVAGDATELVVGGGGQLAVAKVGELIVDVDNDGQIQVGDTIGYRIVVNNPTEATVTDVRLEDTLPAQTVYVGGSLHLDGELQSDLVDGDVGEVVDGEVVVRLGDLEERANRVVTFAVIVAEGPVVSNQAIVASSAQRWLSDGDPDVAGIQPTVHRVDDAAELVIVGLSVGDINGGVVEPGDGLRFVFTATNDGRQRLENVELHLDMTPPMHTEPLSIVDLGGAEVVSENPPVWRVSLAPDEQVRIEVEAAVAGDAVVGDVVEAVGSVITASASFDTDPARLVVGGGAGTGAYAGTVYRDFGERNGAFDAGRDEPMAGFSVMLVPRERIEELGRDAPMESLVLRSVATGADGTYVLPGVPAGRYEFWVASGEGTVFVEGASVEVRGGDSNKADIAIDPSGIVYQELDGAAVPVSGATVYLVDETTGEDLSRTELFGNQQGQRTNAQGYYRFDVRGSSIPGAFRLRVEPPSTNLVFPSLARPPEGAIPANPNGDVADPGTTGRIVDSNAPDLNKDTRYYLRFKLDADTPNIVNNHVPLDRLAQHIRVTKQVNRRTATMGEVLTYTVRIENPLSDGLLVDGSGNGGVQLVDDLPSGIRWAGGSGTIQTAVAGVSGESRALGTMGVSPKESGVVRFANFDLIGRSVTTIRYYGVVGIRAKGAQTNRARLLDAGGTIISNEASATVKVVEDPIFDQGTLLGRVFCDGGDGRINGEDVGLAGARVYLDSGYYADADGDGKFHFRGVPPGRHLIKLDLNTVPPGSEPTTAPMRDFYVSRGLLTKVNFGVRCALDKVGPSVVRLTNAPPKPRAVVSIDRTLPAISLNGVPQPLLLVDAVLTVADTEPDYDSGLGTNLPGVGALVWHIRSPSRVSIDSWQISVFDREGRDVWRLSGKGRPPARVPWDVAADAMPFEWGKVYLYRIAATTSQGDLGEGRWRRLGVGIGQSEVASTGEQVALWRGELFRGDSDAVRPELGKNVVELVHALLAKGPPPNLIVEAHVTSSRNRSANLLLSQRRAVAVRSVLVKEGLSEEMIQAQGKGDTAPLMPNISRRGRIHNERVVIRTEAMAATLDPLPPIAYSGWARVGDAVEDLQEERFEREVEVNVGDQVIVDLRQENGGRVRVVRAFPFAAAGETLGGSVSIDVSGSLTDSTIRFGTDLMNLALLDTECSANVSASELTDRGLSPPLSFRLASKAVLKSWLLRILNPSETVLRDLTGEGPPPESVEWSGTSPGGAVVVKPGQYAFRCLVTDVDGNRAVSANNPLPIGARPTGELGEAVYSKVLTKGDYPQSPELERSVLEELDKVAASVALHPGARVGMEVHDNADGGRMQAQVRSAHVAIALKAALVERGVADEAIDVAAHGAAQPLMPGSSRRSKQMNQRVVIVVKPAIAPRMEQQEKTLPKPHVKVAGIDMNLAEDGKFNGKVVVEQDAALVVEVVTADGRLAVYTVPTFAGRPMDAVGSEVPAGRRPPPEDELLGSDVEALRNKPVVKAPLVSLESSQGSPNGSPDLLVPRSPSTSDVAIGHEGSRTVVAHNPVTLSIAEAPKTIAADLVVWMPADGSELKGERLAIRGHTNPVNQVRINGEAVDVDDDGRFTKNMVLVAGTAQVTVLSEDPAGNVAEVQRSYKVPNGEWFLMAMADTAAGWGARLDGWNDDTTIDVAKGYVSDDWPTNLVLHGRAVGYFKGRIKGESLIAKNPFKDVRVTAHVDTGKEPEADLLNQLIDPERYYPVYGDATEEVQDISSRQKFYVLVEADKSRLTVGNFATRIDGMELFRFHRTYFGASLDVDHAFVDGFATEVHAFAASGETGIRHRQIVLQGTGGSMYFLKDGEILEGSERVELVVRDAITGARLVSVPQMRDVDYSMSYREGRLIFSKPIPSVVNAGWRLNQNPVSTLEGHSVFVEVEYDFDSASSFNGEEAFAFQARQTFFDRVTLGGGIVDEDRTSEGGSHYQLVGGELRVKILPNTTLDVEVAHSDAEDADHLVSVDGGITYGSIGSRQRFVDTEGGARAASGWAGKVQIAGDALEIIETAGGTDPRGVAKDDKVKLSAFLPYALYFQHQDPGFYSGSTVLEQGQSKVGGQVRAILTDKDALRLRHDGVWSEIYLEDPNNPRDVNRQLTVVGYERDERNWKAGIEVGHTYWDDSERIINSDMVTVYGEKQVTPRIVVTAEQEGVLRGDNRVLQGWSDQLATSVGARYQLFDWLFLSATESVRWSGTNSTQLGLNTQITEELNFYAAERLSAGSGRTVSTTVVGGESTAIPGSRSYAEYQLDAMATGESGRAVFGMDNRWTVVKGLKINLSYERSQLVGDALGVTVGTTGYAVHDREVTGYGSSAINTATATTVTGRPTREQQFSASGYSSAGVFPVGISSRDAFAVGAEYLPHRDFKAGARFEIRYDRGDMDLGAFDRLMFYGQAGADFRLDHNLVTLGRVRAATVQNLDYREAVQAQMAAEGKETSATFGFTEGQFMDVSVGLALRPIHDDTFTGLLKWTRRYERRPVNENLSKFQLEVSDVIALEPVIELWGGFQLVGKLAIKVFAVEDADLDLLRSTTLLGLGRVNYHLNHLFDIGAEYRWLGNFLTDESEHGALVEFAWIPVEYIVVGVGYNFTHFSDDLLADPRIEPHGFFLRVTGRY